MTLTSAERRALLGLAEKGGWVALGDLLWVRPTTLHGLERKGLADVRKLFPDLRLEAHITDTGLELAGTLRQPEPPQKDKPKEREKEKPKLEPERLPFRGAELEREEVARMRRQRR